MLKKLLLTAGVCLIAPIITINVMDALLKPGDFYGLILIPVVVIGYPVVLAIGLISSYLARNSSRRFLYSALGFVLPTIILCLFCISSAILPDGLSGVAVEKSVTTSIKAKPNIGNTTSVEIDFQSCNKGYATIPFGFGSTTFAIDGIKGNGCHLRFGTEIENPNSYGKLDTSCIVPTSVGTKEFPVGNNGIQLYSLSPYCKKAD